MIRCFLITGCVAALMFSFDFGVGRLKTHAALGAEQKSTAHAAPSYSGGGRAMMSHGNANRSTSAHPPFRTGGRTAGSTTGTVAAHAANPVLKGQVMATSSKVQQHLYASGTTRQHHLHHHWHWGNYSYLPTNSSSVVIAVPNGNTLTVSTAGAVMPNGMAFETRHNHTGTASARTNAAIANSALASTVLGSNLNLNLGTNVGTVQNVRLAGVAAPLSGQAYSSQSQQHLAAMAIGKHVRIFRTGIDSNGTVVGQVFLSNSGINLNERQLRDGMAFNSVNDGFAPSLAAAEEAALTARAGLWHGKHPIAPWLVTP